MRKHIVLLLSLLSIVVLMFLLNFTNPSEIGPFGILVFFLTFFVLMFGVAFGFICVFRKMSGKKNRDKKIDYIYAVVIGFGPVLLMLMKEFEMLNFATIGCAGIFVLLGCFLVKNRFGVIK